MLDGIRNLVGVAGLPDGIQTFRLQFLLRNPEWWGLVIMNLVYSTVAIWKDAYFGWRMGNLICGSLFLGMGVLFLQRLTVEPLAEKYLPFFELIVFCCLTMCWTGILALLRWFISSKVRRSA